MVESGPALQYRLEDAIRMGNDAQRFQPDSDFAVSPVAEGSSEKGQNPFELLSPDDQAAARFFAQTIVMANLRAISAALSGHAVEVGASTQPVSFWARTDLQMIEFPGMALASLNTIQVGDVCEHEAEHVCNQCSGVALFESLNGEQMQSVASFVGHALTLDAHSVAEAATEHEKREKGHTTLNAYNPEVKEYDLLSDAALSELGVSLAQLFDQGNFEGMKLAMARLSEITLLHQALREQSVSPDERRACIEAFKMGSEVTGMKIESKAAAEKFMYKVLDTRGRVRSVVDDASPNLPLNEAAEVGCTRSRIDETLLN